MIKNPSKEKLRELVDKAKFVNRVTDSGSIIMFLDADQDFGYDVGIIISLAGKSNSILRITGFCNDFPVNDENKPNLVFLCNKWNCDKSFPKVYVNLEENAIRTESSYLLDEFVSEEFILENCIKLSVSATWDFFKSLVKK
ncbi:hypothetical protein Ctha_2342 [Chloroherpeton thalassium ATCC 35110]|uniref:YbjN domain-containing protein n=1 Tax=Chloroherpeton thalassium (strain ATCC 35110 / GB-78) TaxID=517418 RepID=B3QWN2_CHLT3|nr:YbjN domain-containing protein [Chloroherpeton thalassium]ACF14792.1 hypothetical protein Ctha_2342 [Chloroherpeton thalassium ATCC 35110]